MGNSHIAKSDAPLFGCATRNRSLSQLELAQKTPLTALFEC